MTGVAGPRETGLSLNFTAKTFVLSGAAAPPAAPPIDANTAARAGGGYASGNGWRTIITPESLGTGNPQYRWQRIPRPVENDPQGQFDAEDIATAHAMFPYQGSRMWQWLKDQKHIHLDRQRGNASIDDEKARTVSADNARSRRH